jgi:hypothetical protein
MTMNSPEHFRLPNISDQNDVDRHKKAVFSKFSDILSLTDSVLKDSISKAGNIFTLFGGTPDRTVHAMNTRYLARLAFDTHNLMVQEHAPGQSGLDLQWVPNCGLYFKISEAEFRILKIGPTGVPKPTSSARSQYYCSNQLLLSFESGSTKEHTEGTPLSLVVLWDVDKNFKYLGLVVACPRTVNRDGSVDCYWIAKWEILEDESSHLSERVDTLDADLDDIRLLEPQKVRKAKA